MKKLFLAAIGASFLGACAAAPLPSPPIQSALPEPGYQSPEQLSLRGYTFKVYDETSLNAAMVAAKGKDFTIYALTPQGYKALTYNLLELRRYIAQQKQLIVVLRKTIKDRSQIQTIQQTAQ